LKISLERLTELFLGEFSRELVSMILYGSAVKSSFRLGRSDVDLLYILEDGSKEP
jgi:predicted nucleotidyltransferase